MWGREAKKRKAPRKSFLRSEQVQGRELEMPLTKQDKRRIDCIVAWRRASQIYGVLGKVAEVSLQNDSILVWSRERGSASSEFKLNSWTIAEPPTPSPLPSSLRKISLLNPHDR